MWDKSDFNPATDEYIADGRYIHRKRYLLTRPHIFARVVGKEYHYLYEVVAGTNNLMPIVEAVPTETYRHILMVLWSALRQSPYGQQKIYESEFGL